MHLPIKNLEDVYRKPVPAKSAYSTGDLVFTIAVILLIASLAYWFFRIDSGYERPSSQWLFSEAAQLEIIRKLADHKPVPLPLNTTVEISNAGYRYEWNGRWVVLK